MAENSWKPALGGKFDADFIKFGEDLRINKRCCDSNVSRPLIAITFIFKNKLLC